MEDRARQCREDELSVLASFIDEQQQWIDSVLTALGWSEERVKQGRKVSLNMDFDLTTTPGRHMHIAFGTNLSCPPKNPLIFDFYPPSQII